MTNIFSLEVKSVTLNVFKGGDNRNSYSFTTLTKKAIYDERTKTIMWWSKSGGEDVRDLIVIDNTALSQGCPCL